ncbi:hypothetical protein DFJ58DRAFT_810705 [Suillus subalutaceus]|uniref:uncharacterized protein n=1 Tax=Suillus subalutaceus TaxID=48586 RepID=UPI001B88638A|nr:uncharacterized protein DFJ58DRAFT_810705 [Suillus subalutaceus]KAG1840382.1 hypothetical protein DFJ58DRAFT_810705 [Suillus subalutaceus]
MSRTMNSSGQRAPGHSRQRSRTSSDPGHPFVAPPFKTAWPAPARRTTEPMNVPYRTPSRNSSVERMGDPFVPSPGSLLAQREVYSLTNPANPISPGPISPSHHRSSSRQSNMSQAPLVQDVPQPPRTALNTPPVIPTPQIPPSHVPSFPVPQPNSPAFTSAYQHPYFHGTEHQGSSPSIRQGVNQGVNAAQNTRLGAHPGTQNAHHGMQQNSFHHSHSGSHHGTQHRSRSHSRPPSAASHRYASNITQPMYGHGSSVTPNGSRTSLNGTPPKNHLAAAALSHQNASSPDMSSPSNRPSLNSGPSSSRSRRHGRTVPAAQPASRKQEARPEPPPPIPAEQLQRTTQRQPRPNIPAGQVQTRYMNMLLALRFILFPGTFTSLEQEQLSGVGAQLLDVVSNIPLYIVAWVCTGIGGVGMIWLWWRWQLNYIWIVTRIFVPGLLNSLAGVISVLSNIYGVQHGTYSTTSKSAIIVTVAVAVVCGCLILLYQFWLLRNLKKEHDREVGVEYVGKHGQGIMGGERK